MLRWYANRKAEIKLAGEHPLPGTKLLAGIRPEHFSASGSVKIDVQIDVIENLGGSSFAYSNADSDVPVTIELESGHNLQESSQFSAGFDAGVIMIFDRKSKKRLR